MWKACEASSSFCPASERRVSWRPPCRAAAAAIAAGELFELKEQPSDRSFEVLARRHTVAPSSCSSARTGRRTADLRDGRPSGSRRRSRCSRSSSTRSRRAAATWASSSACRCTRQTALCSMPSAEALLRRCCIIVRADAASTMPPTKPTACDASVAACGSVGGADALIHRCPHPVDPA